MPDPVWYAKIMEPMDVTAGTWDRCKAWRVGGQSCVAFVADAPAAALKHTGIEIENFLDARQAEISSVLPQLSPEECGLLVGDLMTGIGQHLLKVGQGRAYSTCTLVLLHQEYTHVAAIGDSSAYVVGSTITRLSGTTRVGAATIILDNSGNEVTAFETAVYIGAEPRRFDPRDVVRVPVAGAALVALVSDGAEREFTVRGLLAAFRRVRASRHFKPTLRPPSEEKRCGTMSPSWLFR